MRALITCLLVLPMIACVAPPNAETAEKPVVAATITPAGSVAAPLIAIAPAATGISGKQVPTPAAAPASAPVKAPATDIASAIADPVANASEPSTVDASCKTDADCTVKNVGNCCGYFP